MLLFISGMQIEWSLNTLPALTACFLSPLPGRACEKAASDFGLGDGVHQILRFPPPFTTE